MNRSDLLDQAKAIVTKDRNSTYGEPEDSFIVIAGFWSTWLGHHVTAVDVAAMMQLLKLARIKGNPTHVDSHVDNIGYAACLGDVALKAPKPPAEEKGVSWFDGRSWCYQGPIVFRSNPSTVVGRTV